MKNQKVTALLQSKGRIKMNESGKRLNWKVRKKRNSLTPYGDTQGLTFQRVNRHEEAELPIRGYSISESVTKKEEVMNKGKEAIVRYVAELTDDMLDDIRYYFNAELFKDGNASGNENRVHGFQSATGVTGSNQFTAPSDTYAGLTTGLGDYGGAVIDGSWPKGSFDPQYYYWSPLIVNYTHADWPAGTDTWANNCLDALTAGIIHSRNIRGMQGQLDLILCTASMYEDFENQVRTKERIPVERRDPSGLVALGFTDVINWDGVDVSYGADVPDTQAYGLNFKSLQLCSWQSQLFVPDKEFDITNLSKLFALTFFGNMKMNPRSLVFWDNIT